MGLRKFLATFILGYEPAPKPKPQRYWHPTDPVELLQHDAGILLVRVYEFRPRDRATMIANGRMTHRRWTAAYRLLRSLDILDKRGEINVAHAPNLVVARMLLREGIERREAIRRAGRFVPPSPERRRP